MEQTMILRVNKNTNIRRPVKYAALSSGTVSAVWYDEESTRGPKRTNRIRLSTAKAEQIKNADRYDA
jgi:hypothetical protein